MMVSLYYLRKCDKYLNEEKYDKALNTINKVNEEFITRGYFRFPLYKSYILFMLKRFEESINYFKESIPIIETAYEKTMITTDEREYLKEYSFSFISFLYKYLDKNDEAEMYLYYTSGIKYEIKNVKNTVFETFPSRDSEKWVKENRR